MRGPLLPVLAKSLGLSFSESGWFLAASYGAAALSVLCLMHALNVWSERAVVVGLTICGVATAVFATAVTGFVSLMLLAVLLGATVSSLGTMANVLIVEGTPPERVSRYMAAMHSMFGFGAMVATTVVGVGVARGLPWTWFFWAAVPVFVGLLVFALQRLGRQAHHGAATVQSTRLTRPQLLVIVTFCLYVAGEVTTTVWMTSYLVKTRGFSVSEATPYVTACFLIMTLSRVACAFVMTPSRETWTLRLALLLPIVALLCGHLGLSPALALAGVYGPFFPVFLSRAGRAFPETWRSLTIWIMVLMNVLLGVCNLSLGALADGLGIEAAYLLPIALLFAAFVSLHFTLKRLPVT